MSSGLWVQRDNRRIPFRRSPFFIREIYKNGFLKRLSMNEKKSSALSKLMRSLDRYWVVFSVIDESFPLLECWNEPSDVISKSPLYVFPLLSLQHISPSLVPADSEWTFVINFETSAIRFSVSSFEVMNEWVDVIRSKCAELGILNPKGNLYSKIASPLHCRNPNSPLPDLPANENVLVTTTSSRSFRTSIYLNNSPSSTRHVTVIPVNNNHHPSSENSNTRSRRSSSLGPSDQETSSAIMIQEANTISLESIETNHREIPSKRHSRRRHRFSEHFSSPEQSCSQLRQEIRHPVGVVLHLRRSDLQNSSLALIELFGGLWIGGWKQKECPLFNNLFHIGDHLVSLDSNPVKTSSEFSRILRKSSEPSIELLLRRIPFAQVHQFGGSHNPNSLGIHLKGLEVSEIVPGSQAYLTGMTAKSRSLDGQSLVPWTITEINGKPMNLFSNSPEMDLTSATNLFLILQPSDLIAKFKKILRGFRGYKDYLLS